MTPSVPERSTNWNRNTRRAHREDPAPRYKLTCAATAFAHSRSTRLLAPPAARSLCVTPRTHAQKRFPLSPTLQLAQMLFDLPGHQSPRSIAHAQPGARGSVAAAKTRGRNLQAPRTLGNSLTSSIGIGNPVRWFCPLVARGNSQGALVLVLLGSLRSGRVFLWQPAALQLYAG